MTNAKVWVEQRTEYYDIAPSSVADIKQQLREHSPVTQNEQIFHGNTQWTVEPMFQLYRANGLCRIMHVNVRLLTVFTLPRLANEDEADDDIISTFTTYVNALTEHEQGHHEFGKQAAEAVAKRLTALVPHYQCEQLAKNAQQEAAAIIERFSDANKAYDATTGHGRTQGAVIR